jgi:hypothetical protein
LLQGLQKAPTPTPGVATPPPDPSEPPQPTLNIRPLEPVLLPEDVLALAGAKPTPLDEADLDALGKRCRACGRRPPSRRSSREAGSMRCATKEVSQAALLLWRRTGRRTP